MICSLWKRKRKRIKRRVTFKAHGDNPLKTYRRRYTDYQVSILANIRRQDRLRNRTRAEIGFSELLDSLGILYEIEAVFHNGDRFVLIDFIVRSSKIAFEIDGSSHNDQKNYDVGRDAWLLRTYGFKTIRITNKQVYKKQAQVIDIVKEALNFPLITS